MKISHLCALLTVALLTVAPLPASAGGQGLAGLHPASPASDLGDLSVADCASAPFAAVRSLRRQMAGRPHQDRFTVRWDCRVGDHDDQVSCVYDRRRAALTATYRDGFADSPPIVSRLYHVTAAVLYDAATGEPLTGEPLTGDGRVLDYSAPFAALLEYGATRQPGGVPHRRHPVPPLVPRA